MSIYLGYNVLDIDEAVNGLLAQALKGSSDSKDKSKLIKYCKSQDIDFNRSINKAVKINKVTDPILKAKSNIIIGVVQDDSSKYQITAWSNRDNKLITGPSGIMINGKKVKFQNISWKDWISYISAFYVIGSTQSNLSDLPKNQSKE